jgi:hypothetical protein
VVSTKESVGGIQLALIIGNGHYPDAAEPLNQPINVRISVMVSSDFTRW